MLQFRNILALQKHSCHQGQSRQPWSLKLRRGARCLCAFGPNGHRRLIAYRAETALAQLAREKLRRLDDARSLIRQLFRTEVDLIPDQQNKAPSVCLHPVTTQARHEVVRHICEDLTATESVFPGTDLRLIYEISGSS
jgi:hypothetical protein